jgi:predicted Zn-dependent peptidase
MKALAKASVLDRPEIHRRASYTLRRERLPGGAGFVAVEMPHLHQAVCALFVGSGARYEPKRLRGISHLLEHMVFKGTERFADSLALCAAAEECGGSLDAETHFEYTAFWLPIAPARVADGIRILAETWARPRLREEDLEVERKIILQEIRDAHDGVEWDRSLAKTVWPAAECTLSPLGDERTVESISRDDLVRWHAATYQPAATVLAVAGAFDAGEVAAAAREAFASWPGPPADVPAPTTGAAAKGPAFTYHRCDDRRATLRVLHAAPSYSDPDDVPLWVLGSVLGGGPTSRLFLALREDRGLAYEIVTDYMLFRGEGYIEIRTSVPPDRATEAIETVAHEVARFVADGAGASEMDRFVATVRTGMEANLDVPDEMASWYGVRTLLVPERLEFIEDEAHRVGAVTPEAVRALAARIFRPQNRYAVAAGSFGLLERRRLRKIAERVWK